MLPKSSFFLKILCIYLFILERGEGREKEREKNMDVPETHKPPVGDLTHNPGICPDWELRGRETSIAPQVGTEPTT